MSKVVIDMTMSLDGFVDGTEDGTPIAMMVPMNATIPSPCSEPSTDSTDGA